MNARSSMNGRPLSWSRLERILSGTDKSPLLTPEQAQELAEQERLAREKSAPNPGDSGKGAGESTLSKAPVIPFAELHACSTYSFLRGASSPADLIETAASLGLEAIALVDRDGLYGAVQFAEAAHETGVHTVFGAELSLGSEAVLTVLCKGPEGYRRLSRVISDAKMKGGEKGITCYPSLKEMGEYGGEHWVVVANHEWTPRLGELTECFHRVVVELNYLLTPDDSDRHEQQLAAAHRHGLTAICSTAATAARPRDTRLAAAKKALSIRADVDEAQPYTHPLGGTFLRSGCEMLDEEHPELVSNTVRIARECAFELNLVAPNLPDWPTPHGYTEASWLAHIVNERGVVRYGDRTHNRQAWAQIDHELTIIEELNFPGYFLIVCDLVDFCRRHNILAQGRGSSANSAVCYALGITNVDPVAAELLFERFLSPEREGPPDIDLDIESGRREEVIQYCYTKYGRENAAQVANVITYRKRGALRDAGRALGHPAGRIDAWVRGLEQPPKDVEGLAASLHGQPRHLGIHSGGMVICDRPIADVVPVEWARMENRSVIQWDKDDAAHGGLVKFDLLGLGMLEAIHHCLDQIKEHRGKTIELWQLGFDDPEVYAMLARADAVGVFQVESRAQLSALPRLKPREFYDLVVQVALIRPGPIQGGSVHPYIRRRNGMEEVTFDHPCLEPALAKTLGVPLFQEQVMRVAVDAAGFSPGEADALRRAMGSKRSTAKMQKLYQRFFDGCQSLHGMKTETIDSLWKKIIAFAAYGFPESHAQSFASIVYFSAWLKYYYPAEFCAALLAAQPMGFYSPQSLVADARRHGVTILPVCINASLVHADCETLTDLPAPRPGTMRLGLISIKGLGQDAATRIVEARNTGGAFHNIADLSRRADLTVAHVEALAHAGALENMGVGRREGMWAAGIAASEKEGMLPGMSELELPHLPGMSSFELAAADIARTGITPHNHPVELLRKQLTEAHILATCELAHCEDATRIRVAGVVTHRQRPGTAGGVVFLGLEDETGLANILISPGCWQRYRIVAKTSRMVCVRGIVQNASGAVTVVADHIESLDQSLSGALLAGRSRDFR